VSDHNELACIHSCSYFCDRPECVKAQRDELREQVEQLESLHCKYHHCQCISRADCMFGKKLKFLQRAEQAERECQEQARLNGMGSEREARLRAQVEQLQRELAAERVENAHLRNEVATERRHSEQAEQREQAAMEDSERMDWLEDITKCYWVTVQTHPSAQHIYSGQGPALRESIDAARQAK